MDNQLEKSALAVALEALKLSSANEAVIKQHLIDCRDRFSNLRSVTIAGFSLVVTTLLSILGYLLTHPGVGLQ